MTFEYTCVLKILPLVGESMSLTKENFVFVCTVVPIVIASSGERLKLRIEYSLKLKHLHLMEILAHRKAAKCFTLEKDLLN